MLKAYLKEVLTRTILTDSLADGRMTTDGIVRFERLAALEGDIRHFIKGTHTTHIKPFRQLLAGELLQPEVIGGKQMGVGFERSRKAEVLSKVYGDRYLAEEEKYEDSITDEILNHGTLFLKAVSSMGLI